jgi:hypothetical protein
MKKFPVCIITLVLVASAVSGQELTVGNETFYFGVPTPPTILPYAAASAKAARLGQPLITFVSSQPRAIVGAIVGRASALDGYPSECIIVSTSDGYWRATLPATATDAEIAAALRLPAGSVDAMDELNAQRARRGIRPFIRDDGLTIAAATCALHRAMNRIAGHSSNDFGFLPAGASADSAGCGAWAVGTVTTDGWTFGTCCADSTEYRYAGAAWVLGQDGRRYMHLFLRR